MTDGFTQLLTLLIYSFQRTLGSCAMLAEAAVTVVTLSPFSAPGIEQPCNTVSPDEKHQELWVCLCAEVSAFSTGQGWGAMVGARQSDVPQFVTGWYSNTLMDSESNNPNTFVREEKLHAKGFYCIGLWGYGLCAKENTNLSQILIVNI